MTVVLSFPTDRIVGTLDWNGAWADDRGPVLATGDVVVPAGTDVDLSLQSISRTEPTGAAAWTTHSAPDSLDLGFIAGLPADAISSLTVRDTDEADFGALAHLAPGLRRLYLGWTDFGDEVLATVARFTRLTYVQTFGNRFTDAGVQQLRALRDVESLYLEEASLTAAAFDFAASLPKLTRLGVQDVDLGRGGLLGLRRQLPGVRIVE